MCRDTGPSQSEGQRRGRCRPAQQGSGHRLSGRTWAGRGSKPHPHARGSCPRRPRGWLVPSPTEKLPAGSCAGHCADWWRAGCPGPGPQGWCGHQARGGEGASTQGRGQALSAQQSHYLGHSWPQALRLLLAQARDRPKLKQLPLLRSRFSVCSRDWIAADSAAGRPKGQAGWQGTHRCSRPSSPEKALFATDLILFPNRVLQFPDIQEEGGRGQGETEHTISRRLAGGYLVTCLARGREAGLCWAPGRHTQPV